MISSRIIVLALAQQYGTKVQFKNLQRSAGYFKSPNTIVIDTKTTHEKDYIHIFFHELGHWYCYHTGLFPIYHGQKKYTKQGHRSTAFRAEQWVDKWAERQCLKQIINFKWIGTYRTKADRLWLTNYYRA